MSPLVRIGRLVLAALQPLVLVALWTSCPAASIFIRPDRRPRVVPATRSPKERDSMESAIPDGPEPPDTADTAEATATAPATAAVEDRHLLKAMGPWDGFAIAL